MNKPAIDTLADILKFGVSAVFQNMFLGPFPKIVNSRFYRHKQQFFSSIVGGLISFSFIVLLFKFVCLCRLLVSGHAKVLRKNDTWQVFFKKLKHHIK